MVETSQIIHAANMAAEHGSSDRASSKRRQNGDSSVDSTMRGLSPARTREPAVRQTIADSPERFSVDGSRIDAASPVAPTQDTTITDLTPAYRHLAAQSALDRQ